MQLDTSTAKNEEQLINRFLVMCIEVYASSFNLSSKQTYSKLNEAGIIQELIDDYEDMHGMSSYCINEYIAKRLGSNLEIIVDIKNHTTSKIILISQTIELIANKYKLSIEEARDRFYKSKVIELLDDDETGLYGESALYLLSLFDEQSKQRI